MRRVIKARAEWLAAKQAECDDIAAQISALQARMDDLQERIAGHQADPVPAMPDTSKLERQLSGIEATNAAIRANEQAKRTVAKRDELSAAWDATSEEIDALDRLKADALAAAKLPVDGLGFDDGGVTFNGVPFSQASSAEQIRVSLAMAMALNPQLRVVRILDGSLLDDDSMRQVAEMASAADYQVWIERVSDDSATAVVIEDGTVQ